MKANKSIFLIGFLISGCSYNKMPHPSNEGYVRESNHCVAHITSYEIPKGIFRGVLWPSKSSTKFQVWTIIDNTDIYYDFPVPNAFSDKIWDVSTEWEISQKVEAGKIVYFIKRKSGMESLKIVLPTMKDKYVFSVLRNQKSQEIIVYMNISENTVDKGFWGYVILDPK